MSAKVTLSSKLPGESEINGLDELQQSLVDNPHQIIVAIVWGDVPSVRYNTDEDEHVPTFRIRKIEPIDVVGKVPQEIVELAQRLTEKRLGRTPLPFATLEPEHGGGYVSDLDE